MLNNVNPSKTHFAIVKLIAQRESVLALSIEIDKEKIGAAEVAVAATFRTMFAYFSRLADDGSEACDGCKTVWKEIRNV